MIVEMARAEFLSNLSEGIYFREARLAICLFIPPEWLHKLKHSVDRERILSVVDSGKGIISTLDDGVFARIGWTTYYAVTPNQKDGVERKLKDEIERLQLSEIYRELWRYATTEIGDKNLQDVFWDLDGPSMEKAREERNNLNSVSAH